MYRKCTEQLLTAVLTSEGLECSWRLARFPPGKGGAGKEVLLSLAFGTFFYTSLHCSGPAYHLCEEVGVGPENL